ncbi:phage tail protein [Salmonella enterica subsp. enterica]|nr:phage tail protein [Salmonella enterica subsp. enterica]
MAKLKSGAQTAPQIYAVLTDRGAELEAEALATGVPVTLSQFCIGDANGQEDFTLDPSRTSLIHLVARGKITGVVNQDNQVTFTLNVPAETGGYTIREVGILTDKSELYSVARSPDILKPVDSNGAIVSVTYKYTLAVSSTSTITVVVNNDYLTPDEADKKYLQIGKNLSEIKDKGADSQKESRENIGVNLDDYYTKEESDELFCTADEVNNLINNNPDSVSGFGAVNSTVFAGFMYSNETVMHYSPGDNIEGSLLFPAYMNHMSAQMISETVNSIVFSSESLSGVWTLSGYMPQSYEPTDGGAESIFSATFATNFIRVA